jgi:hypothetical protein
MERPHRPRLLQKHAKSLTKKKRRFRGGHRRIPGPHVPIPKARRLPKSQPRVLVRRNVPRQPGPASPAAAGVAAAGADEAEVAVAVNKR